MPDYQKIIEQHQKRQLDQMKRYEQDMAKRMEVGKKAQEQVQKRSKKDKDYFSEKQAQDYARLSSPSSQPETVEDIDEQMRLGGEYYQQMLAARQAAAGQEAVAAGEAVSGEGEEGEGDYSSSWQRLKTTLAKLRGARGEGAEEGVAAEIAQQAADQLVKKVWFVIHEFFEDLAFSTYFIASPLCVIVLFIRIIGYLAFNFFFTIRIKGVEVKLFPGVSYGDIARAKTIICILVSLAMIVIIYIATHPCSTVASVFGETTAKIFGGLCGESS